jgi:hypothetical protein
MQTGELWLWEILGETRLERGRRKSRHSVLGLSEGVQDPIFEFRVVSSKIRRVGLMDINLMVPKILEFVNSEVVV